MNFDNQLCLTQIDFYGILSRRKTKIDNQDQGESDIFPPLDVDSSKNLDLWLRSQLWGYEIELEEVSLVREKIENEPIPLRSIRIPIKGGLSSAWAPNGYGKTFIFSHLEKLASIPINDGPGLRSDLEEQFSNIDGPFSRLAHGWLEAYSEIKSDYHRNESDLVPYQALGLTVESDNEIHTVIWLPKSNRFFLRRVSDANVSSEHAWSGPSWAYGSSDDWQEVFLVSGDAVDVEGNLFNEFLLRDAVSLYCNAEVIYHETPSQSDKSGFEKFLTNFQEYIYESEPLILGDEREAWLYEHGSWKSYPFFDEKVGRQLEEVSVTLNLLGDGLSHQSLLIDEERELNHLSMYLDSIGKKLQNEQKDNDVETDDINFLTLESHLFQLSKILFTTRDVRNKLALDFISSLHSSLQNSDGSENTQRHPLFQFLDVLLMEYALATGATIPNRPPNKHTSLWLHYRTISVVRRLVFRDTNILFGGQVEMPLWAKQRIQQLPWVDESEDVVINAESPFKDWAWTCVVDGFDTFRREVLENMTPYAATSIHWPFLYPQAFDQNDFSHDNWSDFTALSDGLSATWMEVWRNSGYQTSSEKRLMGKIRSKDVFFPTLRPASIALQLLQSEINRSLNPTNPQEESNPWAVVAEFAANQRLEFSPSQRENDEVHPHHLSFGMRSEVTLQCILAEFAHKHRSRRATGDYRHQLLILDEPEIGRSEYWVLLLIERFERLAAQSQDFDMSSILIVSHRDKVARHGSPTGAYPEMQKVPEKDQREFEMDDM